MWLNLNGIRGATHVRCERYEADEGIDNIEIAISSESGPDWVIELTPAEARALSKALGKLTRATDEDYVSMSVSDYSAP